MDLDMAMDMLNQEQLTHTISQLDSALAYLASPSSSPPQQPSVLVPSCTATTTVTPWVTTMPVPPPAVANREAHIVTSRLLVGTVAADVERPRRRNGRVSSEPQSVAARLRRERVSQRMRALQWLVPGGARLDTVSMLEEAIRYVRFLKSHVEALEQAAAAMHGRRVDDVAGGDFYHNYPYYAQKGRCLPYIKGAVYGACR